MFVILCDIKFLGGEGEATRETNEIINIEV